MELAWSVKVGDKYEDYLYQKECPKCKVIAEVKTQHDDCPEYHTGVSVKCVCGEWVEFELPVN